MVNLKLKLITRGALSYGTMVVQLKMKPSGKVYLLLGRMIQVGFGKNFVNFLIQLLILELILGYIVW